MVTINYPTVARQAIAEYTWKLRGLSWKTYQSLMSDVGEDRPWRIAYDGNILELRMPLPKHEEAKGMIESFVEVIVDELEIEIRSLGALTLERSDLTRAIEPDSCFYIQNERRVRGKEQINLPEDPPPDLAIESDYRNSSLNKFNIYASLQVPELWRYRNDKLEVYHLVEGKYERGDRSLVFPFLPIAEVPNLIEQSQTIGQRKAVRLFREKIRELLPE